MTSFAELFVGRNAALRDFWTVYEAKNEDVRRASLELVRGHEVFGPMLASAKQEDLDQQNKTSMDLQRRAFLEGDWDSYVTTLHTQASMYAHLQIPFAAWYDLTRPVQQMLLGALVEAYAKEPARLTAALSVMSAFFDQVMAVMAERYIEAREEDRFRRLVDAVEDYSILMLDAEGRVSSWNAAAQAIKGWAAHEVVGKHIEVFYPEEHRATKPREDLAAATRDGKHTAEDWRVRKDGSKFWANVVLTPIKGATGDVLGFAKVTRDLTERRRSEEALRASEESVRTTLESIGDGVISTDREGRIVRMNPVAEALTGYSVDEARGRPFREIFRIFNEQTGAPATNPIDRVLAEGVTVGLANHTALVSKEGTSCPIADSAAPIRDARGNLTGVVLVFRDMTKERDAARAIHEANAFLDSVIENLPNMVFVKDAAELRFVRFNKAGEKLLGVGREDLMGKNDYDFFPKDQADFFVEKDRAVLVQKALLDIPEEPIQTKNGERWLHTKKIPITGDDGVPKYLLGISEDITERRAMVEEVRRLNDDLERRVEERTRALRESEEQLRQSQKIEAIGRLAGGIAHDFNNLLSVILSYGELMSGGLPKDDPLQDELLEVRRAAQRAADLTRQLLAFSRQQVLSPKVTDLNVVLSNMDRMLSRLIGEHIEVRTRATTDLGMVMVDPSQIEQVVMNLVVNARDALPSGGILTLETANVDLDEAYAAEHADVVPGPHVMLAVTDNGTGMDKITKGRIFEPFFTTKPQGKGTGLGLSTVFGIVKQSGGHIWVYSEVGKGTSFKIYLPRVQQKVHVSSDNTRATAPRGTETVLLVEDEEQVRVLAKNVLGRFGYHVLVAENAHKALEIVNGHEGTIHLLLTDVVMPKMSGRELAEKVTPLRPKTKILFMSGYTADTVVHHGELGPGVAFLQKPITPDMLVRKVREVLDAT